MQNIDLNNIDLKGVIDIHVHAGPDVRERKMDAWELVEKAKQHEMGAVVLKNHYLPTMMEASIINKKVGGIKVYGGVALNHSVGGLNPQAVEKAIEMDAKIIWMPTHDAENERAFHSRPGVGINILNSNGTLKKKVYEILELIFSTGVALATGHLTYEEILILAKECKTLKIPRLLINHPGIVFQRFTLDQQQELVKLGALLEHSYCRPPHTLPVDELVETIRHIGPSNIVLATDLGQPQNVDPIDGMKELIYQLLSNGFELEEINLMTKVNPKYVLNDPLLN
jgi:hypothetical protein